MNINQTIESILDEMGSDDSMDRNRPYDGQPHTDSGTRGSQQVHGVTMRDLRDCLVRAIFLSTGREQVPHLYDEANKGTKAMICDNDLFLIDYNQLDPVAITQNFTCEVERIMGIYPNVPELHFEED